MAEAQKRSRGGRPSLYTPELAARFIARLTSMSMRAVCRSPGMPAKQTIQLWLGKHPEFLAQYTRAMVARGCGYGEKVVDIVDRVLAGEVDPNAARVAIDGLKWAAARMAPKVYGDRVAVTGADGGAIKHEHKHDLSKLSDAELDTLEGIVGKVAEPGAYPGGTDTTQH